MNNLKIILKSTKKRFIKWNDEKIEIHCFEKRKYPQQGEIWICIMGKNIGSEQNNTRPVLVINKPLSGEKTCVIIPASSTERNFSVTVENFNFLPHQIKTIDTKRLKRRINRVSKQSLIKVMEKFSEFQE